MPRPGRGLFGAARGRCAAEGLYGDSGGIDHGTYAGAVCGRGGGQRFDVG